jgi:hypothetical protein
MFSYNLYLHHFSKILKSKLKINVGYQYLIKKIRKKLEINFGLFKFVHIRKIRQQYVGKKGSFT